MPGANDSGTNCPALFIPGPEYTPPAGEPLLKVIGPALLFNVSKGNCSVTTGGVTVMVNRIGASAQPLLVATTVKIETNDDEVVFVAVNDGIDPTAETGIRPMSGTGTVRLHCIVAVATVLEKTIAGTVVPAQ